MNTPKSTTVGRKCSDSVLVGVEPAVCVILLDGPTTSSETVGMVFVQFATIENTVDSDDWVVRREEYPPVDTV
jgi:hypothetical protein